jgi:aldehyde dehydrogenase (NAD+)
VISNLYSIHRLTYETLSNHINYRPDVVQKHQKDLRKAFNTGKTQKIAWRRQQLLQCALAFTELAEEMNEALYKDLGRENFVSFLTETGLMANAAKEEASRLEEYTKPDNRDTPILLAPASSKVIYQPLGAVCILGAWNYPFTTTFSPVFSALAAGNCCLLKPSEMSPNCSAIIRKIVEKYLDNECFKCVEGGAEISIACSQVKWDKICFTGSPEKGKLVAQAAAKNLVPCILELGGKCITIVDESANARVSAMKVVSAKMMN